MAGRAADFWLVDLDDGHHALHHAAVLGAVNALRWRFDRASARPSGIDRACAQRSLALT
jgi:hypothetical protein